MEFHYGKHHTAYLNNLNGQIAGKPLEQLPSVHEVRPLWQGSQSQLGGCAALHSAKCSANASYIRLPAAAELQAALQH